MQSTETTARRPTSVSAPTATRRRFDHQIRSPDSASSKDAPKRDGDPVPRLLEHEDREQDREGEDHSEPAVEQLDADGVVVAGADAGRDQSLDAHRHKSAVRVSQSAGSEA